jgi:hypothetical protein
MKLKKRQARHSEAVSIPIPGIFSWFGYDLPISERFQKVKAASFKRVSIWLGEEEELAKSNRLHDWMST